jgi:predicted lipoprotein with Yx(FWY)xxD motif
VHLPRFLPIAALAAATLALSACGADAGDGYTSNPAPLSAPAAQPPSDSGSRAPATAAAPTAPAEGGAVLVARDTPALGTIVTDAQGYALYRFDQDKAKPPTATCEGECAAKWPPIIVDPEGKLSLTGVDQSLIGMVQRSDGTSQLTLGGWALYRYSGDTPGTTKGQAIGNTWFAATPEGKKAPATP